jgi:hypothetical protein
VILLRAGCYGAKQRDRHDQAASDQSRLHEE